MSNNQTITILNNVSYGTTSSAIAWNGGKGKIYVQAPTAMGVNIQVSVDGGTTWIPDSSISTSGGGGQGDFSQPPLFLRAVGQGVGTGLSVFIIGYDGE